MKNLTYIAIVLIVCSSCGVLKQKNNSQTRVENYYHSDSTIIIERMKLDTLKIASSTIQDSFNMEALRLAGKLSYSNGRANTVIKLLPTGNVGIETTCDSAFQVYISQSIQSINKQLTELHKLEENMKVKEVYSTPLKMWLVALIPLLILLLLFILKIKKSWTIPL